VKGKITAHAESKSYPRFETSLIHQSNLYQKMLIYNIKKRISVKIMLTRTTSIGVEATAPPKLDIKLDLIDYDTMRYEVSTKYFEAKICGNLHKVI